MKRISLWTAKLQFRELFRLSAFDTSTSEGRSQERHRRILFSTLTAVSAKVVAIATQLISVPLTLHYLGVERYGMWLTISSFIAILAFADLGMGNGLLNRVAAAHGRDDRQAIGGYVSSAFAALLTISLIIILSFSIAYSLVPWHAVFNVQTKMAKVEAGPAVAVFAVCFALSVPTSIVQKVQAGLQSSFVTSAWNAAGNLLGLGAVFAVTQLHLGLPWLVAAFAGAPVVMALINSVVFFGWQQPDIAPKVASFSTTSALDLARAGSLFLVLQIVSAVSYSSDPLIISHILGPAAVAQYSVPERMFSVVGMLIGMGLAPLWPAYGEAISRGERDWVRATFRRSMIFAIGISLIGSFTLFVFGPTLLRLWVGNTVSAGWLILLGLATWKVIESAGAATAMFLNGAHIVRFQLISAVITATATISLKFLLIQNIGVSGAVWATILAYSTFTLIPTAFRIRALIYLNGGRRTA